jgi:hypothetical protein
VIFTHAPDRIVARSRILAALERFEHEWDDLIDSCSGGGGWPKVNAELDALRALAATVPELSADFAELIMRHAQVLRSLVKHSAPNIKEAEVAALRRRHKAAIEALRARCMQVVG